ncbi:MAG: CocE/NonD family hydrolase [Thermoanaerobaculia bacterium]
MILRGRRHVRWACAGAIFGLAATFCAAADEAAQAAEAATVDFLWGVKIPMRDGVHLNATLYAPRDQSEPAPCVFTLTPYISQTYHGRGVYFAAHGYPFLTVDVRGRGNSEGDFRPMIQEAEDGHDIVEWLARQPYCNGKVAMWGGSYAGYNQWATAKELPPHLATIVPAAAAYLGYDFPARNNIFTPYDVQWLTLTSGRTGQREIFGDDAFWRTKYLQWYESGAAFREIDTLFGNPSEVFQEWVSHPHPDAYWDRYNPTAEEYGKIRIPILTITGSHDDDQPGALKHYREHLQNAPPEARARHYLVIGPWDHAGTRTPKAEFGGLSFGPASLVDLPKLHLDWYAWTMGEGPRPEFLEKRVAYYVMGAEKWRYADTLEAVTSESRLFYLDSKGTAGAVFASGSLSPTPGEGPPDSYRYDPRDRSPAAIESTPAPAYTDQRLVYAQSGKQLVYHSAPFSGDTELSGIFKLSAWIAIDQPDTDFVVSVYEIRPDGSSIFLTSDILRARYRESLRDARLIDSEEPLRYEFDRFTFVSREVRKGSRLRLVIGPIDSIYWQKNYNSGRAVAEETIEDARAVTVMLYHDRNSPSALVVPLGQPEAAPGDGVEPEKP